VKKLKLTKETIGISLILILSAILNFANIGIEGYGNGYYAAGVKSMMMSLKNFFFVSFDPAGFVTIDKPPMGFWIQTIFAKVFGYSGWSILLPQALAGVVSVYLIYYLVKRSFGTIAGFISALCLAVTPVFVAASRNNTIDNLLVVTLLFACLALTKAAEIGKAKYLYISLLFVGIGFNIKMLEAYMIGPAIYITYLLSSAISFKKRIGHLVIGTVILITVSLSWTIIVDLVPAQNRPYVGSSTNNSVMELIIGHNGLERLGLSGKSNRGPDGNNNANPKDGKTQSQNNADMTERDSNRNQQMPQGVPDRNNQQGMGAPIDGNSQASGNTKGMPSAPPNGNGQGGNMQPPGGGMPGGQMGQNGTPGGQGGPGGQGSLQGSMGGQIGAGATRLFSKNSLSDQIVWFLPLALLGFIAGAIKENLRVNLDNKRKVSLVLWITWLVPEFIYFSYTTGLFHPYYLTMMAPPAAALVGIGITTMWSFYKESTWKSWFLPIAFAITGATHMMMLSYFTSSLSTTIRSIILGALVLCFSASAILSILNITNFIERKNNVDLDNIKYMKLKRALVGIAIIGILATPFIGASAAITHSVNSTIPSAGLELLSNTGKGNVDGQNFGKSNGSANSKLINFLESNITNEKYALVVSSSQSADNIIIQSGQSVMSLGGFSGSDNIITLDQFKELVKNGEVRYVLTGGMGRGGSNEIMNWVTQNGKVVSENEYKQTASNNNENSNQDANSKNQDSRGFGGNNSEQLYDLKSVADTLK
jgi:4-amino-4-deoxy-L-arabinose transferase-like glycosyltransferase